MQFAIEQRTLSGASLLELRFYTAVEAWATIPALAAKVEQVRSDPKETAHVRRLAGEVIGFTVLAVVEELPEEG